MNREQILLDEISDMVFVVNVGANSEFIYDFMNHAAMEGTGLTKSILGKSIQEVNLSEQADFLKMQYQRVISSGNDVTYTDSYHSLTGKTCFSQTKLTPILDENNSCKQIVAVVRDITDIVEAKKKRRESEERLKIIMEHTSDLITLVDDKGIITYASPSHKEIVGFDYSEYVGKFYLHNVHPEDRQVVNKAFLQAIEKRKQFNIQFRQFNSENQIVWSEAIGTPVYNDQHNFMQMVVTTRDIGLHKKYESKLEYLSRHDSLTGLYNRRWFKLMLNNAVQDFQNNDEGLTVILMDVDDFKHINDNYGHDVGDVVIEEIGKRISKVTNQKVIAARLGGDEFVLLLSGENRDREIISFVNTLRKELEEPWEINGDVLPITTSMGVCIVKSNITSYLLLKNADIALYNAKEKGKNSVEFLVVTDNYI